MSTVPLTMRGQAALVGFAGDDEALLPVTDGWAAGQQGHGLGRAAIVGQEGQERGC